MNTKKRLILFLVVLAIVSLLASCSSVGFAQGTSIIIESQIIKISEDNDKVYWFCVDLDPVTQCPKIISISYDACKTKKPFNKGDGTPRAEIFRETLAKRQIKNIVGLPCNSFVTDAVGNTVYLCTPWKCYP